MMEDDVDLLFSPDEMGDWVEYSPKGAGTRQEIQVILQIGEDGPGTAYSQAGDSNHAYAWIKAKDVAVPQKGDRLTYINEHADGSRVLPATIGSGTGSIAQLLIALFGGTTWQVGGLEYSDGQIHQVRLTANERVDFRRVAG
jgi:hypothetical protein